MNNQMGWGAGIAPGVVVTSDGRHGAGQPKITGRVILLTEHGMALVETSAGARLRSVRRLRRVSPLHDDACGPIRDMAQMIYGADGEPESVALFAFAVDAVRATITAYRHEGVPGDPVALLLSGIAENLELDDDTPQATT
jgi:hypothetical protein